MSRPGDADEQSVAHPAARDRAPGWLGLIGAGAALGAVSAAALAVLQLLAAARAELAWLLERPASMPALYLLAGASAGALGAAGLELARRMVMPRLEARALVLGVLAVAPAVSRAAVSAGLRARDVAGGRTTALLVVAALGLGIAALVVRALRARGGRELHGALAVALSALAAVLLVHLDLLAGREAARLSGLVGWSALGLLALALCVGAGLGLALGARRAAVRGLAGLLLGAGLLGGLGAHGNHGAPVAHAREVAPPDAPNVLLVVLDTLRRDAVSAYGEVRDTTPRLDALAARGVRWDDALAPGNWTLPSHASLFTGAQVTRHGAGHARRRLRPQPGGPGTAPLPTLAELLAWRGYRTAAFVCNMNVSAANGFARGFHEFHEVWRGLQGDYDVLAPATRAWLRLGPRDKGGAAATRGLEAWLGAHGDDARPWLLFVNMMEPHAPYHHAPAEHARRFLRDDEPGPDVRALLADPLAHTWEAGVTAREADVMQRAYLGAVSYQDELFGRLLDALEASGAADDTLVVVTSDHGEHFGALGLLGHGQDLGDDLLRVPFVAAGPGLPRGVVDPSPISLLDVLPSLQAWTGGAPLPDDPGRTGLVLDPWSALSGGTEGGSTRADPTGVAGPDATHSDARARVAERYPHFLDDVGEYHAAVDGGDRVWAWGRARLDVGGAHVEHVEHVGGARGDDPDVEHVGSRDAAAPPLDALLERLLRARASWPLAFDDLDAPALDDATREQLRAMGYVGS